MKLTKQLLCASGIAVVFLLAHILIASFELGDVFNLIFSLVLMISAQGGAFIFLKRAYQPETAPFTNTLGLLCFVQFLSIILLTLNSAFNPFIKNTPVQYGEVLVSLLIFGLVFPLLIATIIWLLQRRKTSK